MSDTRTLIHLAYPEMSTEYSETVATRCFVEGLLNRDIAMRILYQDTQTLQSAYEIASRWEPTQTAEESRFGNNRRVNALRYMKNSTVNDVRPLMDGFHRRIPPAQ